MKVLTLIFCLTLISFFSNAQMIVDDNGQVGVGAYFETNTTVPGSSAFHVSGVAYINGGVGSGVTIEDYIGDVLLRGGFNNGGYLGKSNQRWGNIYTNKINGVLYTTSDLSIKENITPIENATPQLMKVNPVTYDIKASYYQASQESKLSSLVNKSKGTSGMIAQELRILYPQLVNYDEGAELYEVNYQGLIPHMIKAIQEQQEMINDLIIKVQVLEKK